MAFKQSKQILYSVHGKVTSGPDKATVTEFVSAIPEDNSPLVIWFHGGLVASSAGVKIAENVGNIYSEGFGQLERKSELPASVYSIFFVWESGVARSLIDSVAAIFERDLMKRAVEKLTDLLHFKIASSGKLGLAVNDAGAVLNPEHRLSDEEIEVLRESLEADLEFSVDAQRFALAPGLAAAGQPLDDTDVAIQEFLDRHNPDQPQGFNPVLALQVARAMAAVAVRVFDRRKKERDHGIKQTVIEETVRELKVPEVWRQIKGYTDAAFAPDGVGTQFLQELAASGKLEGREVYLAGHSTGAVYIANLLKSDHAGGMEFHVRFLAPAIRFDRWRDAIQNPKAQIKSFRSYGMLDDVEKVESLLDVPPISNVAALRDLYKGSLLYMVSGALEVHDERDPRSDAYPDCPIVGMQRFASLTALSSDERAFVDSVVSGHPDGWIFGPCGNPFPTDSRTHGGFDDKGESALWSLLLP